MKLKMLGLVLFLTGVSAHSQTMRIAHRSHSGTNSEFTMNTTEGNFGETPEMAKQRQLREQHLKDSLSKKAVADSIARVNAVIRETKIITDKVVVDSVVKQPVMKKKKRKIKIKN